MKKKRKSAAKVRPGASKPKSQAWKDAIHGSREDLVALHIDECALEDEGEDPKSLIEQQVQVAREALPEAGAQWRWLLTRLDAGELQRAITGLLSFAKVM